MKTNALEQAVERLSNPRWRMDNLYWIVDKEGQQTRFKMNWAQESLYEGLWYCNIVLKARQLGISTFILLLFLDRCLFNSNCSAGIICHTREDAEMLFRRVKFAYEHLPEELRSVRTVNQDNARELRFNNGSLLRVGTSMRGSTLQYLHISEFGKICAKYPEKAREVVTGSLNTIAAGQYVIIESTAEGRDGFFYDMCQEAKAAKDTGKPLSKLDYKMFFFPWHQHPDYWIASEGVAVPTDSFEYFRGLEENHGIQLSAQQKAWYIKKAVSQGPNIKREYPSTQNEAFETANEGLYHGALMSRARQEGRIRKVYYDESLPVCTAWDLGFSDSTAIWFFQICGQEIHLLEFYESSGEPLTFYLKLIKDRPYAYLKHFAPHDIAVHEYSSGLSRIEVAAKHGITFTIAPNISVDEGIDAVRNILNRCFFDEEKCAKGIKALETYKRAWNDTQGCWAGHPVHNAASHCCDAIRMLAVSLNLAKPGMSPDDVKALRHKALYGAGYAATVPAQQLRPFG